MSHTLICGLTESGKTYFAKSVALEFARKKQAGIVLDPHFSAWPNGFICFANASWFLTEVKQQRSKVIFADEAGDKIGRNSAFDWLGTNARHRGHKVYFLSQFPTQLKPVVRGNCSELVCFKLGEDAAKVLRNDFPHKKLVESIAELKQYEFVRINRFGDLRICKINVVDGQRVAQVVKKIA